jgi:hypothetical protein
MHLHIKEKKFMAPINPYLLRTGMPYASHEFSFDTDMYNTRWCFVIDDTNDPHKYFRAVFTSTRGNFDDKSKEFNKEEFRCLLLCCFQIMLEDMRLSDRLKFSTEELTELLKISQDNINKLKLGDFRTMPGILANILLFFFPPTAIPVPGRGSEMVPVHPSAEMRSILVPSLSHFCVYVADAQADAHYVRMM